MKITGVNLFPFQAERVYKTKTAALGGLANYEEGVENSDFAIVEIETDAGVTGYGEISDIPPTMKMPSAKNISLPELKDYLSRLLIGRDPFDLDELMRTFPVDNMVDQRPDGTVYDIVSCGIDNAILDIIGKRLQIPVYNFFGGKKRDEIWVSWVAFIREIEYLEQEIAEKVAEGFNAFKLKVGISFKEDEERLRIIRQVAGDDAVIKLDANSGWSYDDALQNLKRLAKYNPAGIETPIPYLDIEGKAKLKKNIDIPILEHVHTPAYAIALLKHDAVDVFNVSTVGCGGVYKANKIMIIAESEGIPCLLGSTVEAGLGTAAQLHLASCSSQLTWPSDLVGPKMYKNDVITVPHQWNGSMLKVTNGHGFGVNVDKSVLGYKVR
jgi:L-alanine-DL-glutamate epimerase-like enolase superfamily enzyme